jgi:hypothetical protein
MKPKQAYVTITDDSDDNGKMFVIEKMHAEPLEDWGMRVLLALARSKIDIPSDIESAGIAGLLRYGFTGALSQIHIEDLRPLLAEMFECIQIIPDPANRAFVRPLVSNDIEEVSTRLKLRADWIYLHTGFSIPGVTSTSTETPGSIPGRPNTPNTRISRKPSGR